MNLAFFKFVLILIVIIYLIYQSSRKIMLTGNASNYFIFLLLSFIFTFDLAREIYLESSKSLPIIAQSIFTLVFVIWFFIFFREVKK
jgi:hypothetical protein